MSRYEWPPLPVLERDEAARRMGAAMESAWNDLEAERLKVLNSATLGRKRLVDKALREFQNAIETFAADVAHHLDRFAALHLGPAYMDAVTKAGGAPSWNGIHEAAFVSLATDTYDDFLKRSVAAGRTAESFARAVRTASAVELPKIVGGGKTARQAARLLENRLAVDYAIDHVRYANDARVGVRTYSEMAALTKSGVAYNAGTLNESAAQGVEYMEVFDGTGCGWSDHNDPDRANGSVRSIDECAQAPLSHPRCRRAFGARPDVRSKAEAKKAQPTTTEEQRANTGTLTPADDKRIRAREKARERRQMKREERRTSTPEPSPAPAPAPVQPPPFDLSKANTAADRLELIQRDSAQRIANLERQLADPDLTDAQREVAQVRLDGARTILADAERKAAAELKAIQKANLDAIQADFTRRELASVNKGTVSPKLKAELPEIDARLAAETGQYTVSVTNPMFTYAEKYQINCQNATASVELRARGLDVMARAVSADTKRAAGDIAKEWVRVGEFGTGESPTWTYRTGRNGLAEWEAEQPTGARGFVIYVHPGRRSAHIINWRKVSGDGIIPDYVEYLDGQVGSLYDVDLMMKNRKFSKNELMFLRVDDADIVSDSHMLRRVAPRKSAAEIIAAH